MNGGGTQGNVWPIFQCIIYNPLRMGKSLAGAYSEIRLGVGTTGIWGGGAKKMFGEEIFCPPPLDYRNSQIWDGA